MRSALEPGEGMLRALGVSRVARVTGLDRTGVEVACAVRPRGHVLQVANGKGETAREASAGAILEAAELWAAESVDAARLVWGSRAELRPQMGESVWDAACLGSGGPLVAPELWSERTRLAWREGTDLVARRPVLVPAQALHCPPPEGPPLGPAVVSWTTNGMGAHPDRDAALLHALLEALERDQLARSLPEGWTEAAVASRLLDPGSLPRVAPRAAALVARLQAARFDAFLFDLAPSRGAWGLPVAGALLFDNEKGAVSLTAGYCCRADPDSALQGSLLEAAQSRLTDIHGAREDVSSIEQKAVDRLRRACERARARRRAEKMARLRSTSARACVREIVVRFARAMRPVAAFDLEPDDLGLHVVKVVIPGFLVSELL